MRKRKISRSKLDEKALKCKFSGYDEHSPGYNVQKLQARTALVAGNKIFRESEKVSLKSDSQLSFNDFPDIEQLSLRQNPIETEVREQITDGQTIPSDQTASHECFATAETRK